MIMRLITGNDMEEGMRLPSTDLVHAMQPFRSAVLPKRPELWPEIAGMDIQEGVRHIALRRR